jgi:uncharacterized protein
MINLSTIMLCGIIVACTHFIQGISGFGCAILTLPFFTILIGVKAAVPIIIILSGISALLIIIIDSKNINWNIYLKMIFLIILGIPIGMWFFSNLNSELLKKILALFMIVVSIKGLYNLFILKSAMIKIPRFILNFFLFLGGILQGAFGTGGPIIVIIAKRFLREKRQFRVTLCMLWLTLNSIITTKNIFSGVIDMETLRFILLILPFLLLGLISGNFIHHKLDRLFFTKVVYVVFLLAGVFMFL